MPGLKPPLTQTWLGSGVPGKGFSAVHFAHAQSEAGTVSTPSILPSIDSCLWMTSFAFVVSSVAGLYGNGFVCGYMVCDAGPLAFMMRPNAGPVMEEPSAFFAVGTTT